MSKTVIWGVVIVIVIAGAWYVFTGGANKASAPVMQPTQTTTTTPPTASTTPTAVQPQSPPLLTIASSTKLGEHLVATNGMTLYTFKNDKPNVSNCSGACATLWPPYVIPSGTSSLPVAPNVMGKVGTISRGAGAEQLTYNGMPLYFYKSDTKVGETAGEGLKGLWYVVKP